MSRLDDELKLAFKHEEPTADFANRVMARINTAPAPKRSLWQSLISVFQPPRLRWLAVGAAASLIFAIVAYQQGAFRQTAMTQQSAVVAVAPQPESPRRVEQVETATPALIRTTPTKRHSANHRGGGMAAKERLRLAAAREERLERARGEAAKRKVMLALHIASSALNDAQEVIQGSDPGSREPLKNR